MSKINSATKRMLALLLAMLLIFSGVAVTSSASDENQAPEATATTTTTTQVATETTTAVPTTAAPTTTTVPTTAAPTSVPTPVLSKSDVDRTITVKLPKVPGYNVNILVEPAASYVDLNNGSWCYVNLTPGQKYTFKAYIVIGTTPLYSTAVTETIKDKYPTPDAPVATKVTSTSITAYKVSGCEYKLVRAADQALVKDWSDNVLFENLTAETIYVLSIRKKGDNNKYASDPKSITIKTLKTGDTVAVGKPVLVDKTNTTITVACAKEDKDYTIEFSIDKGKTWQYSGEFKNLTPETIYGVIARKVYDPAVQDANPVSEVLELKTNKKARFEASVSKCTFKLDEGKIYADQLIGVTVTGDAPSDLYLVEYGDTRLVPYAVYVGGREFSIEKNRAEIMPGKENANKKAQANVVFTKERYIGGGCWEAVGKVTMKQEFEVGPEKTFLVTIGEFFVTIANFFLDTIPSYILGTGEYWEKGLAALFGMFDKITK